MKKVHLLIKKEDIDEKKMNEGHKIAVVLDVLLATTTIAAAFHDGAKEVIPVMDHHEGAELAKEFRGDDFVLAGEDQAKPIDGFVYPNPLTIRPLIPGKTLILSTTNGTVALRKSSGAKKVYVASLLNNPSVAEQVSNEKLADTILVVCSGTSGEFSLEDFYGAGHFLACLLEKSGESYDLTDAAKAALLFYKSNADDPVNILRSSRIGQLFAHNQFIEELNKASQRGAIDIVPVLKGKTVVIEKFVNAFS
jgi:2-phosphosulfolactate phosphatase